VPGQTIDLRRPDAPRRRDAAALEPGTAAWLALPPTAVLAVAAIVLLGPPLGGVLFPDPHVVFWQFVSSPAREPTEQARFLIAIAAPVLLAALTVLLVRHARAPARVGRLAHAIELAACLFVVGCVVAQRLQAPQNTTGSHRPVVYFTLASIAVAVGIAGGIAAALRSRRVRAQVERRLAGSGAKTACAFAIACAATAVALLPAVNTDASIMNAFEAVGYHLFFTYDETMAVVDGRSPLGDFATQYAALWPYALAAGMSVLGTSLAAFTGLMAALTGVTLLALYDLLRRLARSSLGALLLFLPLLATCGFRLHGPAVNRFSLVNYFGVMPLRYAGPFLLAWLVTRHLSAPRQGRTWPLFLVAGLGVLNNADFGLPALGATVAALAWARTPASHRGIRRELLEAGLGLAAAAALVTALVLGRTGALPDLSLLFRYTRVFALAGFAMLPIKPLVGIALVIFLTHAAAIGVATVRALRGDPDRALIGMLAWSGVFGLGSGSYYVGHSLSELVVYTFPPWGLSVVLLTLVTVRSLAQHTHWPTPAELACLVGFGLLVCSLGQLPAPGPQLARIRSQGPPLFAHPPSEPFVGRFARPGEPVLIVALLGHRIAASLGVEDVEPYSGVRSIFTHEQLVDGLAALRAAGGDKVFLEAGNAYGDFRPLLVRAGYSLRTEDGNAQLWMSG